MVRGKKEKGPFTLCDRTCHKRREGGRYRENKQSGLRIRKPYSPTKFLVPPTILVRVGVHGLGLGFWNLVGGTRDLAGE